MVITVFSIGDSKDINLWSNMPYFLTKGLEECGCIVNRVNVSSRYGFERIIEAIFNRSVLKIVRGIKHDTTYTYSRSTLHYLFVKHKIKTAIKKYRNTDIYISLSFSLPVYIYTNKKTINICDWTYEFDITHDKSKPIDRFEKWAVKSERDIIKNTTLNVVWRDDCRIMLSKQYENIFNSTAAKTINIIYNIPTEEKILEQKRKSSTVVFIGATRYKEGARVFIEAVTKLNKQGLNLSGFLIGISGDDIDIGKNDQNIHFLGYLHKANEEENKLFYETILDSRAVINTNPGFVSVAGIKEACFMYTPIIVSQHIQTETELGNILEKGLVCPNDVNMLAESITSIFEMPFEIYMNKCRAAHEYFKESSWKQYMFDLIKLVEDKQRSDI